jgi:hypothetical protein
MDPTAIVVEWGVSQRKKRKEDQIFRQQVVYKQMYRQLIQPIDDSPSISCLMLCMEVTNVWLFD